MKPDKCIYCPSKHVTKNGSDGKGEPRFKCSSCGRTFTVRSLKHAKIRRDKRLAAHLLLLGYSVDDISVEMKISSTEIHSWQKKYLPKLNDLVDEKKPITDIHRVRHNITNWAKDQVGRSKSLKRILKESTRRTS